MIAVDAATSAVIYCICAACTARISVSIPVVLLVVVSVAAEADFRLLIVVMLSPPPNFSSEFSASRLQAYPKTASYSDLVTVLGTELSGGVSLVPRRAAAYS